MLESLPEDIQCDFFPFTDTDESLEHDLFLFSDFFGKFSGEENSCGGEVFFFGERSGEENLCIFDVEAIAVVISSSKMTFCFFCLLASTSKRLDGCNNIALSFCGIASSFRI